MKFLLHNVIKFFRIICLCLLFILFIQIPYVYAVADIPALPGPNETPESKGWIFLTDRIGPQCVDLASVSIQKARFFLILNKGDNLTATPGADVDGLIVNYWVGKSSNNPHNDPWNPLPTSENKGGACLYSTSPDSRMIYPNAIYAMNSPCWDNVNPNYMLADPRDCNPFGNYCPNPLDCSEDNPGACYKLCKYPGYGYTVDENTAKACPMGWKPDICTANNHVGACHYVVLDVACSNVISGTVPGGTGIVVNKCSSVAAEHAGRVAINGPGDDICFFEVGTDENYRVYVNPYKRNNLPSVSITSTPNCAKTSKIDISVSDADGNNISQIELVLKYEGIEYTYRYKLTSNTLEIPPNSPFNVSSNVLPAPGSNVVASLTIDNLAELGYKEYRTISYKARAKDQSEWSPWTAEKSFNEEWYYPSPEITATQDFSVAGGKINVIYVDNGAKPGSCEWRASGTLPSTNVVINTNPGWNGISTTYSPTPGPGNCSGSRSFTPAPEDTYTFKLKGGGGLCGSTVESPDNPVEVYLPKPWVMTGWGDSYVLDGYRDKDDNEMGIWKLTITGVNVPKGGDDSASFSTYIISKMNGPWSRSSFWARGRSFSNYLLDNYDDSNRVLFGSGIYKYFNDIRAKNNCSMERCKDMVTESAGDYQCVNDTVYFRDGNLVFNSDYNSTRACAFIVSGDVIVNPGVSNVSAFIITDGTFKSLYGNNTLVIKGGLITRIIDMKRNLLGNNYNNPSELIEYDAKYIDLLRELIGEDYPFKIKEYRYFY